MTNELSPAELAQRLESLESRLAYQEHWLDTLDQAVAQQERRLEKLEQLRVLENGYAIRVTETERNSIGVDRLEDLNAIEQLLSKNK